MTAAPKPIRIKRERTKGWRMPPNTVCVSRPSFWGNQYNAGDTVQRESGTGYITFIIRDAAHAVQLYREFIVPTIKQWPDLIDDLRGKNLACWCKGDSCHAEILLELANK